VKQHVFQRIAGLCLVGMIAGCQNLAPTSDPLAPVADSLAAASIVARDAALSELTDFSFTGGLGIWTSEESIPARIQWQQSEAGLLLKLTGPMGLGDMQLVQAGDTAVLTRGQDTVATGTSADQIIQRGLGLSAPVPVEELKQWVRGLPGEASTVVRDASGKLASLRFRDGTGVIWEARFKRYTMFNNLQVPALITATGGPYNVRLVMKNWQSGTEPENTKSKETNNRLPIPRR